MVKSPVAVAYGLGVDSTALLVELTRRGERPDAVLFADVGGEKDETYAYLPVMQEWLRRHGMPEVTVVKNVVGDFKHWPPYETLEQNCLTNGTLPSLAFGFKSCSIKWKQVPQHKWVKRWDMAEVAWAAGLKVTKLIGFDAGPKDIRRRNHVGDVDDKFYAYRYPLIEWGWDRDRCKRAIREAGLPVPPKSSCFFCPAMKPAEVRELPADKLRRIVVMEARAEPRLEKIRGLWRNGTKGTRGGERKPGRMTDFIVMEGLLPGPEVTALRKRVPLEIVQTQEEFAAGADVPTWDEFFCSLDTEDD
jgi:hypothetical protein